LFALGSLQSIYQKKKDIESAIRTIHQQLDLTRKLEDPYEHIVELTSATASLIGFGSLSEAERLARESIQLGETVNSGGSRVFSLLDLTGILFEKGNLSEANKLAIQLKDTESQHKWFAYSFLGKYAEIQFELGHLSQSKSAWKEMEQRTVREGNKYYKSYSARRLAKIFTEQNDFTSAAGFLNKALEAANEIGSESAIMIYKDSLAAFHFAKNDYKKAEELWKAELEYDRKEGNVSEEADLLCDLAECRLLQGDSEGARQLLSKIKENAPDIKELFWVQSKISLAQARLFGAQNKPDEGMRILNTIIQKAAAEGMQRLSLDANLLFAELELQAGKKAEAKSRLDGMEKRARSLGFLNKAQRASLLRQKL
jgi:tetratricopeptide (TPR) repeat protein